MKGNIRTGGLSHKGLSFLSETIPSSNKKQEDLDLDKAIALSIQ